LGVAKFGEGPVGERVGAQGAWLEAHQDIPCLPRIAARWAHGYVMEPLEPIDWPTVDIEAHIATVVDLLDQIWAQPAETLVDLDAHLRFVQDRCRLLPEAWPNLQAWALDLEWPDPVLIHGDPTFVNQVRRQTDIVFLDPNPGSLTIPSVRAHDLAHLAQSLLGYEAIKFGWPHPPVVSLDVLHKLSGADDAEWDVVRYLTAVKFVRLLTYDRRPEFVDIALGLMR
jgi:hypothetical protein